MARCARKKSESGIFHIILRGVNKQTIFEEDGDRQRFLETIKYYKTISHYKVFAYCLMNNHVHLLIQENPESISTIIKRISSSYVFWYNRKYKRCGHLFQERFKSESVENTTYFLTVIRYIHQNPIKAGLIRGLKEFQWSSYNDYLNGSEIVDTKYALGLFSCDIEKAAVQFRAYSNEPNEDHCLELNDISHRSDDEVVSYLKIFNLTNKSELQKMEKSKRNEALRGLKYEKGISIRQLSRITGISKSIIERI